MKWLKNLLGYGSPPSEKHPLDALVNAHHRNNDNKKEQQMADPKPEKKTRKPKTVEVKGEYIKPTKAKAKAEAKPAAVKAKPKK